MQLLQVTQPYLSILWISVRILNISKQWRMQSALNTNLGHPKSIKVLSQLASALSTSYAPLARRNSLGVAWRMGASQDSMLYNSWCAMAKRPLRNVKCLSSEMLIELLFFLGQSGDFFVHPPLRNSASSTSHAESGRYIACQDWCVNGMPCSWHMHKEKALASPFLYRNHWKLTV